MRELGDKTAERVKGDEHKPASAPLRDGSLNPSELTLMRCLFELLVEWDEKGSNRAD
jgi:hypothetical protein